MPSLTAVLKILVSPPVPTSIRVHVTPMCLKIESTYQPVVFMTAILSLAIAPDAIVTSDDQGALRTSARRAYLTVSSRTAGGVKLVPVTTRYVVRRIVLGGCTVANVYLRTLWMGVHFKVGPNTLSTGAGTLARAKWADRTSGVRAECDVPRFDTTAPAAGTHVPISVTASAALADRKRVMRGERGASTSESDVGQARAADCVSGRRASISYFWDLALPTG
jgi:hypothetical protein